MIASLHRFPRGTPSGYVSLCLHCLEPSPKARPSFEEVLARLDALYAKLLAKAARSITASQPQPALIAGPAPAPPSTRLGSRLGFLSRVSSRPNMQQPAEQGITSSVPGVPPPDPGASSLPQGHAGAEHHGKPQRDGPQPPLLPVSLPASQQQQQGYVTQAACSGTSAALPLPSPAWPSPQPAVTPQPPVPPLPTEGAPGSYIQSPVPLQGLVQVMDQVTWAGHAPDVRPPPAAMWPGVLYAAPGMPATSANYVNTSGVPHQQLVQQAWAGPLPVQAGQCNNHVYGAAPYPA
jgi:hypothetical protein